MACWRCTASPSDSVGRGGPFGVQGSTDTGKLRLRRRGPLTGLLGTPAELLGPGALGVPGGCGALTVTANRSEFGLNGRTGGVRGPAGLGYRGTATRGGQQP